MRKDQALSLRSHCPINFAVELFGDKWSLLIIRDIVFWGKRTHREFMHSQEHIATNILADRLEKLERQGVITKTPHPTDKRQALFGLTPKGLALVPILIDMAAWSVEFDNQTIVSKPFAQRLLADKPSIMAKALAAARQGEALFVRDQVTGEVSVK